MVSAIQRAHALDQPLLHRRLGEHLDQRKP